MTVDAAADNGTARQGRPRPQDVIERDNRVYQVLHDHGKPVTRNELATLLGIKRSHVYLSLIRLQRSGRVRRTTANDVPSHSWEAVPPA